MEAESQVALLVPVLGRPHRVKPLLESVVAATAVPHRVCFIPDPHDQEEIEAIYKGVAELHLDHARYGVLTTLAGNYAAKINLGCRLTEEPYIFTGADDLHFHRAWFENAVKWMVRPVAGTDGLYGWGRNSVGVVGTNDLCNRRTMRGQHSTHSLVARWYIEEQGVIDDTSKLLYEGYLHEYVDDEFVQTAMHRGMWAHATDSIVEHLHPMAGKAEMDDLYAAQRTRMRFSRQLFLQRCALWT